MFKPTTAAVTSPGIAWTEGGTACPGRGMTDAAWIGTLKILKAVQAPAASTNALASCAILDGSMR